MKSISPRRIAWISSIISTTFLGLIMALLFLYSGNENWLLFVLGLLAGAVVSYVVFQFAIENFVHAKIKIIYKTIHQQKRALNLKEELDFSQDVIGKVNREVIEWASENRNEIASLREQAKYRREFIGNLSHELKTPLFLAQGYLLTLLEGGLDDKQINKDYLLRADNNVQRLMDLVEDLDGISKLDTGDETLNVERIDIVKLVKDILNSLELNAEKKSIKLLFNKNNDKPIYAYCDPKRIAQVVTNLVVNGINYNTKEGYVKAKFYDMDENILVEFEDNGIGISQDDLPRLFERFYRVDKSRSRHEGGTGLGLSIVKHFIEAHKQTINVRSELDKGSTFSFTLSKSNNLVKGN